MSRITDCFKQLKSSNRKALIPFLTAGDPDKSLTAQLMHELVAAGADMIELGVPFSDPMADGPVIQRASERALKSGTSSDDVFEIVREFREQDAATPVVLMGYLNPVEVVGYETFAAKAETAGVDGVLIVDLPPEEAEEFSQVFQQHGINQIFLISPTTGTERLHRICEVGSGFLYYVSLKGVTGSDRLDTATVAAKLDEIRSISSLPLGVGFGIKDAETAAAVARICDAVVVGSALVERIAAHSDDIDKLRKEINGFISTIRQAMDRT
ncbi:MAG: tryptophan synthase subunit alpha [Gammaproteobacteria bacterium]